MSSGRASFGPERGTPINFRDELSRDTTWNFRPLAFSIYRFVERSRWILEKKKRIDDRELEHFRNTVLMGIVD